MQHIAASRRLQQILIGCNKSLLEARGTFWPFWAHAAIIRSCQQLPQAPTTAAPRAVNPFSGPTGMFFFGRAAQAEAFEAELLAEPTVRGNKSFFGKNDSGDPQRRPRAGLYGSAPAARRTLPPKPRLLLARHHQRANKASVGTVSTYSTHLRTSVHPMRASRTL
jgi:hypothetical protein